MSYGSSSQLINVRQFKDVFLGLVQDDYVLPEETIPVEKDRFSTDDLMVVDPDEQIRAAIEREMTKPTQPPIDQEQRDLDASLWSFAIPATEGPPSSQQTHSEIAEALMETADIPSFETLKETKPTHLKCLDDSEKYEPKSKKREVNYFTDQMQQVDGEEPLDPNDVILAVAFYHPQKNSKTQEYYVLGSQCLTELKDKFYCLSDEVFSDVTTKSGYFFIENVFYNDKRSNDAVDYSDNVIEWVKKNQRFSQPEFGIYTKKKMEDTTFNDLVLRIGTPYLYCHRGNCEHIMVFTDVRLINDTDNMNKRAYPLQKFQNKIRRKKCRVCDIYPAR